MRRPVTFTGVTTRTCDFVTTRPRPDPRRHEVELLAGGLIRASSGGDTAAMVSIADPDGGGTATLVDEGTASAHVCRDVPRAAPAATAGEVRKELTAHRYETVADIAVCHGDRLVGLVPVELVLAAPEGDEIGTLMDSDPPVVGPGTDQEVAAWKAVTHGETSLAVVDADGRFVGDPQEIPFVVVRHRHAHTASRSRGQLMQRGPPRPRPSSLPAMVMTSIPALRSLVLVSTLRS